MKNYKEKNVSVMWMIFLLLILYIWGISIYSELNNYVTEIFTPKVQKEYYVSTTIYNDEGEEVSKGIPAEEAYIKPLASACSLLLIMWIVASIAYFISKQLYKRNITFKGISKIVEIIEMLLIFVGMFVFGYKLNCIDTRYGIYKDTFDEISNLSYYPVVELPVSVDYLYYSNIGLLGKMQKALIVNSSTIVGWLEVLIAVSGAILLPLKYCVKKETDKQKQESNEKMKSDICKYVVQKLKKGNHYRKQ